MRLDLIIRAQKESKSVSTEEQNCLGKEGILFRHKGEVGYQATVC